MSVKEIGACISSYLAKTRRRGAAGFGLVEVLISLLVLSIGLLGVARLQIVGVRSTHGSFLRGQAIMFAYDMADRMRANRIAVVNASGTPVGFYNSADGTDFQSPSDNGCTETGADFAADCSVAELAANDTFEWQQNLVNFLPEASGTVCIDSTPDDGTAAAPQCDDVGQSYAVKVFWTEMEPDGPAEKRYVMRIQL